MLSLDPSDGTEYAYTIVNDDVDVDVASVEQMSSIPSGSTKIVFATGDSPATCTYTDLIRYVDLVSRYLYI